MKAIWLNNDFPEKKNNNRRRIKPVQFFLLISCNRCQLIELMIGTYYAHGHGMLFLLATIITQIARGKTKTRYTLTCSEDIIRSMHVLFKIGYDFKNRHLQGERIRLLNSVSFPLLRPSCRVLFFTRLTMAQNNKHQGTIALLTLIKPKNCDAES